jgi:hypothetical protein
MARGACSIWPNVRRLTPLTRTEVLWGNIHSSARELRSKRHGKVKVIVREFICLEVPEFLAPRKSGVIRSKKAAAAERMPAKDVRTKIVKEIHEESRAVLDERQIGADPVWGLYLDELAVVTNDDFRDLEDYHDGYHKPAE